MTQISKEYELPFCLEPTKLTRVLDTIHERLADRQNTSQHDTFEVFLTGAQRQVLTTLDDVLKLDNTSRHKIERLLIVCSALTVGAARPDHEVQVDFGFEKIVTTGANTTRTAKVVTISVLSDAPGWASSTLSAVEEQVERTWLHYGHSGLILFFGFLAVAILLASQVLTVRPMLAPDGLTAADLKRIEVMLSQQATLTDESLREIQTTRLRNIVAAERAQSAVQPVDRRVLFVGVPLLVVFAVAAVLLRSCYPRAVFLWGDETTRYARAEYRRRLIWNVVIGITVVGVLSGLLAEGVSSWLRHGP